MPLHTRACWIFDMDGTLTESLHDFPAISRTLGLPENEPILEALDRLPPQKAAKCNRLLAEIELDIARKATPQPGAHELLRALKSGGKRVGILTRNTKDIAHETLAACGLADFFEPDNILGRSCCAPKPRPDGILKLLAAWAATPTDAVMTGDHQFDLLAGRNAKVAAVYLDPDGNFPWKADADYAIDSLEALRQLSLPPAVRHPGSPLSMDSIN
ncbi:MAG: HAD family hydrolase [Phormidesmis sp.]